MLEPSLLILISTLFLSIVGVWIGSGLVIKNALKLAKKLGVPTFMLSFILMGFLTSATEIAVAVASFTNNEAEISAGNLLGGIIVLFLFLIPLVSIFSGGIRLTHNISRFSFFLNILGLMLPGIVFWDGVLTTLEAGIILVAGFLIYFKVIFSKEDKLKFEEFNTGKLVKTSKQILLIILGTIVLIIASNYLVKSLVDAATAMQVDPFVISLLGLSLGTNLPEISLAVKSVLLGRKDMAIGNYMGSATFNILILGVLGLASGGIVVKSDFTVTLLITLVGLVLFWLFMLSKDKLSRREGLILFSIYLIFLFLELI